MIDGLCGTCWIFFAEELDRPATTRDDEGSHGPSVADKREA